MNSYTLASGDGLKFGFYFFLAMSAAIAFMLYALLTTSTVRRTQLGIPTVRKGVAALLALLIWLALFSTIYFSSLAGFHVVIAGIDHVELQYAVPNRSIALGYGEIGDVIRRPAYKTRWRLEIFTLNGERFASAPGAYQSIKAAAEDIDSHRKR